VDVTYSPPNDAGARCCVLLGWRHETILILAGLYCFAGIVALRAQSGAGALEFTAKVTPTAAKAEPAREFTVYLLTKSYDQIVKELDERTDRHRVRSLLMR